MLKTDPSFSFTDTVRKLVASMETSKENSLNVMYMFSLQEYSSKQLLSLVCCACQNNKKTRQRLSGVIEEMERLGLLK